MCFILSSALFLYAFWSRSNPEYVVFPFDDSLGWEDQVQLANARNKRYCELNYPRLHPNIGAASAVEIQFLKKQFKMVAYMDAAPGTESFNILEFKYWEADITARAMNLLVALRKLISDGFIFIDHGAGVGWYTYVAASLDIPVISIAFSSNDCNLIRHNLCLNSYNSKVTLIDAGLSMPSLDLIFTQASGLNVGVMKMDVDGRRPFFATADKFFRNFPPLFLLLKVASLNSHQLRSHFYMATSEYGYRLYDRTCVREVSEFAFYALNGTVLVHVCLVHNNLELSYNLTVPGH
jgi:hypothetical protein